MNLNLNGKTALVGGASRGIGAGIAKELALLGCDVILLARDALKLAEVVQSLDKSKGQKHRFLAVDFSEIDDLKSKIHNLVLQQNIHILVNNTGGPKAGKLTEATNEDFTTAFNNHILCNQILSQLVLEGMKEDKYGRIINIISTSVKQPIDGLGVSNTIRGAVANWSKTLSNEVGEFGITVNNVLPGFTATDRLMSLVGFRAKEWKMSKEEAQIKMESTVPLGRFGTTSEIGAAVAFLASPAAAFINGINLPVDGGRTKGL